MYERIECESCGKMNLSNVLTCICGEKMKGGKEKLISHEKCNFPGCSETPTQRLGEKVWTCEKFGHQDKVYLSLFPESLFAKVILHSTKNKAV